MDLEEQIIESSHPIINKQQLTASFWSSNAAVCYTTWFSEWWMGNLINNADLGLLSSPSPSHLSIRHYFLFFPWFLYIYINDFHSSVLQFHSCTCHSFRFSLPYIRWKVIFIYNFSSLSNLNSLLVFLYKFSPLLIPFVHQSFLFFYFLIA